MAQERLKEIQPHSEELAAVRRSASEIEPSTEEPEQRSATQADSTGASPLDLSIEGEIHPVANSIREEILDTRARRQISRSSRSKVTRSPNGEEIQTFSATRWAGIYDLVGV